jgi:CheY-like chemotaxis protein
MHFILRQNPRKSSRLVSSLACDGRSLMSKGHYLAILVDDNDDHCMLIEDMLVAQRFARAVIRFPDAESALAHLLEAQPTREGEPFRLPDFIFLDIRLPGMSGIELLQQLKANPRTRPVPTIMLTTSERHEEITASFAHGACGYIVKPVDLAVLAKKIKALRQYWESASEVPKPAA